MRRKRLHSRPNFRARTLITRATPLKGFHRHGFPHRTTRGEAAKARRLPSVRRNAPRFGRMTSLVRTSFPRCRAIHLKRFNGRRFSSRSDPAITILPQAVQRRLAKKALLAERLSHLAPCRARFKTRAHKTHSE
jgi:hypothetical protein